ncbi:MAG: hypothetical protein RLZZ373_3428 [Pseudomonadota bacterium]|jgi:outer membrane biosynthesis protein TonB
MFVRSKALAACVSGSVALHVGMLLSGELPASMPTHSRQVRGQPSGMQVRMHAEPAPRTASAARVVPPATPVRPVQPAWDPETLPPTGAGPATAAQTPAAVPQDGPAGDPDATYLSRSQLTRAPAPQQSIDLLYPELAPSGRFRAVVTLFIDDRGVVQRVRIDEADDSGLPPLLEDATRQTFLRSAFAPGEVDGRPTRSRLRIEVEYTTEPLRDGAQTATR